MVYFISNFREASLYVLLQGAIERCQPCGGTGTVTKLHQIFPGMVQQSHSICFECRGAGEKIKGMFSI